jgi:hypothetical protein
MDYGRPAAPRASQPPDGFAALARDVKPHSELRSLTCKIGEKTMAILPVSPALGGDWTYYPAYKHDEVNQLHTTAVALQNNIQTQIDTFNGYLDQYKTLVAGNSALVIVGNILTFTDLQYKDFTVAVDAVETPPVGFVPVSIASMVDELAGGVMVLKALWQVGKFVKQGVLGASEALPEAMSKSATEAVAEASAEAGIKTAGEAAGEITAETVGEGVAEGAAEAAIEGASLAALDEIGIGIFAAVAIDVIFGAISEAKENSAIDDAISRLRTALKKCQAYYNALLSKQNVLSDRIVDEEKRFQSLVTALAKVTSPAGSGVNNVPTFKYDFETTFANAPQFVGAIRSALTQYGAFATMRNKWVTTETRNPAVTKDVFLAAEAMLSPLDESTLDQYFIILAAHSDSMRGKLQ